MKLSQKNLNQEITTIVIDTNSNLPSPCFVCEEKLLEANLQLLDYIQAKTNVKILLALKGFAQFSTFQICKKYLKGCCASGLNEAILAKEEFGKEVHTYSPAFKPSEFKQISEISDHIIFNSFNQLELYKDKLLPKNSIGIRVNPQFSSVKIELYNPCTINSRLGVMKKDFQADLMYLCDGLHFHTLCEQNVDALEGVLEKFISNFKEFLPNLKWVNFGGGHLITKKDYDVERLIKVLNNFKKEYPNLEVYLEPGEAIGWQTGYLEATILDIIKNDIDIAILDTSAEAHMPDTLAMPYVPSIRGAKIINNLESKIQNPKFNYRLAGNTCLAGDIVGDYSFDKPLEIGDKIILEDMIHYTMVKTTTFNGINLPSIAIKRKDGKIEVIKNFGYEDYKNKLS